MRRSDRDSQTQRSCAGGKVHVVFHALALGVLLNSAAPLVAVGQTAPAQRSTRVVRDISDAQGGGRYVLSDISALKVSSSSELFILDRSEAHVLVLDTLGRYKRTIGRRGSGPGELSGQALAMQLQDSLLLVSDLSARRLVVFGLDGRHVRTVSAMQASNTGSSSGPVTAIPMRGGQIEVTTPGSVNFQADLFSRVLFRHAGRSDTIAVIPAGLFTFTVQQRNSSHPSFAATGFGDGGAWAVRSDTVLAHADGFSGRVRWITLSENGPRVAQTAMLPGPAAPLPRADFDSVRVRLEASYKKRDPSTRLVLTDAPTQRSLATHALFDATGNLWIGGAPVGRTVRWTVFSPRAQLLYTVSLPASFRLNDVRNGRLYGKTVDEDGVPVIRILELIGP